VSYCSLVPWLNEIQLEALMIIPGWYPGSPFSDPNPLTPGLGSGFWDLGSHSLLPKTGQLLKDKFICTHAEELCDAGSSLELGTGDRGLRVGMELGTKIGTQTESQATVRQVLSIMQTHTQRWRVNGMRGSGL